ncbi:MAG: protein translocase subunit SecF [Myxococcales bacterium]|nr:protein translocase subunit SecF [Myxococcales bacterium]MCB9531105.1 protein translocase subunit SecF [Myxococcales bacterium]MCB9533015.1 protein translocase subunit SecF [Myxococcales bacterium]
MSATRTIDFIGKRRLFSLISGTLVLISLILTVYPGPRYGIDFAGGTNIITRFNESVPDADVRAAVERIGLTDASVVRFGAEEDHQFLVQTRLVSTITDETRATVEGAIRAELGAEASLEYDETSGDKLFVVVPESAFGSSDTGALDSATISGAADAVAERLVTALGAAGLEGTQASLFGAPIARRFQVTVETLQGHVADGLRSEFGDRFASIDRVETVGPRVGEQLRADAVQAILFALAGILLYIAFRFDLRYAPGAVIALFHDVMITLGIFVILREEINLPILAALLTIVGYSLNDTIVNFDRIRENIDAEDGRYDLYELVNRSVNEVLSRTLLTAFTTVLAILAIYFLGGGLVRSFALAMLIGVVVGTYSSIYIANPLMIWTSEFMAAQAKRRDTTP